MFARVGASAPYSGTRLRCQPQADRGEDRSGRQAFSKLFPNISKFVAWNLQTFPNIYSSVLSLFNGLQGIQERFFDSKPFSPFGPNSGRDDTVPGSASFVRR
jgi:hypothetical protein